MPDDSRSGKQFGFSKRMRVCKRNEFLNFFKQGNKTFAHPFLCYYSISPEGKEKIRMAVTVRKKHFKKAVDRNRIKRLTREVFRLNQQLLSEQMEKKGQQLDILLIYIDDKILSFDLMNEKFKVLVGKLTKILQTE